MSLQERVNQVAEKELGVKEKLSRDELRARVFAAANKTPKRKVIDFFGVQIELRQGSLGSIIAEAEDKQSAIVKFLVANAYVPNTDEKAFEEGDAEQFLQMPFGEDFVRVTNALQELSGVNFQQTKGT